MTAEELKKKMPKSEKDEMDKVVKLIVKDYGKTIRNGIISGFKLEHRSTKITHEKHPSEDERFCSREFSFTH
ncbi:hypothetical protein [Sharpea azabuensis]|uniref:hypothetical protein n=1 Tax=Sharpea azabuensis TaxID=322505 RepID=UPI0015653331|nr:hypothetical protein [Sharpea azabuensis]